MFIVITCFPEANILFSVKLGRETFMHCFQVILFKFSHLVSRNVMSGQCLRHLVLFPASCCGMLICLYAPCEFFTMFEILTCQG